jgi:hypothetical protein
VARGPENTFIASVHRLLPETLYRMKNHNEYNGGIPDCWYSGRYDLWVEYKFITIPKRDTTLVVPELSTLQREWVTERYKEGRAVGVIVGCKEGGVYLTPHLLQGISTEEFRARLRTRRQLADLIVFFTSNAPS